MADEEDSDLVDEEEISSMKSSSSLQHMLAVIAEERKRETATFSISGGCWLLLFLLNDKFCESLIF